MWWRVFVFLGLLPIGAPADVITGRAEVEDAETLILNGRRLPLYGLFAPQLEQPCFVGEMSWPCGEVAVSMLREVLDNEALNCEPVAGRVRTRYVCQRGEDDINAWLLREGWALASAETRPGYEQLELEARNAEKGIWRGGFEPNASWRLWAAQGLSNEGCDACTQRKQRLKKKTEG